MCQLLHVRLLLQPIKLTFFQRNVVISDVFITLAEAVDFVAMAVLQVGTSFCLSHTCNLLQYRDVRLQETTHDRYMCDCVSVCARFILIGLSVRVAFYTFVRVRSLGHVNDLASSDAGRHPGRFGGPTECSHTDASWHRCMLRAKSANCAGRAAWRDERIDCCRVDSQTVRRTVHSE